MWGYRFFVGVLLGLVGFSAAAKASTLPLNQLHLEDNPKVFYRVTPNDFHRIIQRVIREFAPIVRRHGAELQVEERWYDSTVNAFADRPSPNVWSVHMFGGLARRKEVSQDGFALVVCHELGHHLGGYPYKWNMGNVWAASEGQSDYFATQVCARKIWEKEIEENARHRDTVPAFARRVCDIRLGEQKDRDLCYRTAEAGLSLANLLNRLQDNRRPVAFETFSRERVQETYTKHPQAQCRLDTYLNGAACRRPFDVERIPGDAMRLASGSQLDMEKEAALYSCEDTGSPMDGSRPACWFRPLLSNW